MAMSLPQVGKITHEYTDAGMLEIHDQTKIVLFSDLFFTFL